MRYSFRAPPLAKQLFSLVREPLKRLSAHGFTRKNLSMPPVSRLHTIAVEDEELRDEAKAVRRERARVRNKERKKNRKRNILAG